MKAACLPVLVLALSSVAAAEDIFRESFEGPLRKSLLANTWGDVPAAVAVNSTEPGVGRGNSAAARLSLTFPAKVTENLSHWSYALPQPVPLCCRS
jgi:hypothetical protein